MGQTEHETQPATGYKEVVPMVTIPEFNVVDTWLEDIRNYDDPRIGVNVYSFDELLGKLFVNFELLGLPERQAKALTGSVRRMAWEWYDKHLPNPQGLASPSMQARRAAGIEIGDLR